MADTRGFKPVTNDETLYRRIPKVWYSPTVGLSLDAFLPTVSDTDGLSLSRQCVGAEGAAATGRIGKEYYIVQFRTRDLPSGLTVQADSFEHAVILQMNYAARKEEKTRIEVRQWAEDLRRLCATVAGPFPGKAMG